MRKQYADKNGIYLGWMSAEVVPEGAVEVPIEPPFGDCRFIKGEWKRPESRYFVDAFGKSLGWYCGWDSPPWEGAVEVAPPEHGLDSFDHNQKKWVDFPEKYKVKRADEYMKIPLGDQLDAIYKFATANNLVTPDPNKPVDTPEGWVAKIQQIKARNPKPQ